MNIESGCVVMPTLKGSKWSKFKLLRRRVMRNLIAWKNKEKLEAVFPEDYQKVNDLTDAIHFLDSLEYGEFYDKCPMCGEADLTIGKAGTMVNLPQQLFNTKTQQFVNTSGQSQQQIPQNHIDALRNNPNLS